MSIQPIPSPLPARFTGVFTHGIDGVSLWLLVGIGGVLAISGMVIFLSPLGQTTTRLGRELRQRWSTWLVIATVSVACVLGGAFSTAALVALLSLVAYHEFARSTGLFRTREVTVVFLIAVVAAGFGALDNRFAWFTAVAPLSMVLVLIVRVLRDDPKGYLQSVSLGVVAVLLLAVGPAYLTMLTIDARAIPLLLMLLAGVALGDVSAFIVGKLIGGPKLAPNTSPGKTIAGSVGSLLITATFFAIITSLIYADTTLDSFPLLTGFGLLVASVGQLGDLVLSSIKRDVGVKDFGTSLPGHGGVLDRVDSLLLSAPAAFYYLAYFVGVGTDSAVQVFTR